MAVADGIRRRTGAEREEELVAAARADSREAVEKLLARCEPMVRALAATYRIPGCETGDLRQIARLGVLEAIRDFDPGRGCSFLRFAGCCARRQLLTAAEAERQPRRRLLNEAVSLPPDDPIPGLFATEPRPEPCVPPVLARARPHLTCLEYAVAAGWCEGRSYAEMARALGVPPKSVDNAWKRAKTKMRRLPIWDDRE
jgi:RNA polymerase sporulation-specific sigma factor